MSPASKTFRVHFTDTRYFHVDVKSCDAQQAEDAAQLLVDGGYDGVTDTDAGEYGAWFATEPAPPRGRRRQV